MLKLTKTIEDFYHIHAQDPNKIVVDGEVSTHELIYTQRLVAMLADYVPHASIELLLAAHCQHLRRWAVDRSDFQMDKQGYYQWRKAEAVNQSDAARQVLESRGWDENLVETVIALICKKSLNNKEEAQQLEDVVCLTFVKYYLEEFADKHDEDKMIDIIKKTMAKMSAKAIERTAVLNLSGRVLELVGKASRS